MTIRLEATSAMDFQHRLLVARKKKKKKKKLISLKVSLLVTRQSYKGKDVSQYRIIYAADDCSNHRKSCPEYENGKRLSLGLRGCPISRRAPCLISSKQRSSWVLGRYNL
jgi:hypothetical protein